MILFSFAALLLSAAPAPHPPTWGDCADLEKRLAGARLDSRKWRAFREVARHRAAAKLEPLPGFPACENVSRASADLSTDRRTVMLLRRAKLSRTDYLLTGWAAVVARYPTDYPGLAGDTAAGNRVFVDAHRDEVDALFRGE